MRNHNQTGVQSMRLCLEPLLLSSGQTLPHALFPGPMEGLMGPLFLETATELKLTDFWMTPFLRISTAAPGNRAIRKTFALYRQLGLPFIPQLLGSHPEFIAETAYRILSLFPVPGINLNFACPSKTVVAREGGGRLLSEPWRIVKILKKVMTRCPHTSISVKLRTGLDSPDEMEQIIPAIAGTGIDFIILHYRTVAEMYRPVSDGHARLARAVQLAGTIPIIGSGDIFTLQDTVAMHETSGCRGITVARGLLRNPFLIRQIQQFVKGPPPSPAPDGDEGRNRLFHALLDKTGTDPARFLRCGHILELTHMIWGKDHPRFQEMKMMNKAPLKQHS